ncbi:endosome/lysosome-associated apoptosis and autophagy regulator family member 2-like isoform X2 [Phyllopteryx taeniolatus]|uniref:endosome/lysosome-associated apoptosis and autophagy regulator family member 2-like isoform X2 n=1 Tax=Phyllopteryx taeniolatus TaxID=161469 RepID=UPI002AD3C8EC|nr:endosome/lysosome-associated apoptosis and autophagy regulator family member 2-like isoform X2 [Phyllopteryx taeniolatus]
MREPAWASWFPRCLLVLPIIAPFRATYAGTTLPPCDEMDYYYQYTECDNTGSRWRVAIPLNPGTCSGLPPPSRGTDCSFSCSAGKFLEMSSQSCTPCAAGSYSLGSGLRFDQWDALPAGFISIASFLDARPPDGDFQACSNSTWTPRGVYLESNRDECTVSLVYMVHLEKRGSVSFTYQYPDSNIFFQFYVQNEQCQEMSQSDEQKWIEVTGDGEWGTHTINLWAGTNILYWRTTGILVGVKMAKPVLLKDIKIEGVAYTSECFPCRPGWYSASAGSSFCRPCPADTFSGKSSASCAACPEKHYSLEGWAACKSRPPCAEEDYFQIHTPCDSKGKTQAVYRWVEPKICDENATSAVALPAAGPVKPCPPCNPGFYNSNDSTCSPCPPGTRSDGTYVCTRCPSGTEPVLGYEYRWWNVLPSNMKTSCFNVGNSKCDGMNGWEVAGDHVRSGAGSSDNDYLILSLQVPGFKVPASLSGVSGGEVAQIAFEFETVCAGDCEFYFMTDVRSKSTTVVESWEGSKGRQSYSHSVSRNDSVTFTWAFQRTNRALDVRHYVGDNVKLFSVHVTNVLGGVASGCRACALVPENSRRAGSSCVPCPPGFYIHAETNRCEECPAGTHLAGRHAYGGDACVPCGPGSVTNREHSRCYSDCSFSHTHGNRTLTYDLGALSDVASLTLEPGFTTKGTKYLHLFNISLCGHQGRRAAVCRNNLTDFNSVFSKDRRGDTGAARLADAAEGFICQSTIVPADRRGFRTPISSQSVGLADTFLGATVERFLDGVSADAELFPENTNNIPDINFFYRSTRVTASCDRGRSSVIAVRCNPRKSERGELSVPSSCPAGTCDGCAFHFLWESASACPLCTQDDYHQLDGACKGGTQETFSLWNEPKLCIKGVPLPPRSSAPCESVTLRLKLGVGGGVILAVLLVALTCYFWKMNKRLEYKYSRMVMSANKESELPAADSCGLDEGEDPDPDDAVYTREPSLLGKLRAIANKHEGEDSSESVQLNSSRADCWVLG